MGELLESCGKYRQGFFSSVSEAEIRPQFGERNSQSQMKIIYYSSIHCKTQVLFEMLFKFDFMLLLNDFKCISLINYVNLENIINFEHSEKFTNLGVYVANFPNQKGPRALSKIAKKIPDRSASL